jgi:nucleoside-diphosphate-sugar epimerase
MKVVITGSHGFIGGHIKNKLEQDGHEIIEWDHHIDKPIENFILNRKGFNEVDYVIHMAAWADVRASLKDPDIYWENNVTNTTRIQRQCHEYKVPLIYASSSCIHEWHKSPYGISKKVNEETAFPGQVGLRFTTVYGGAGANRGMFMDNIKDGNLEYATNHVRDFVHIDDVVRAIVLLMGLDIWTLKPTYDIGTGEGNVVSDLAKMAGYDVPIKEGDECEAQDNTADITDIKELGWIPWISVRRHINTLWDEKLKLV